MRHVSQFTPCVIARGKKKTTNINLVQVQMWLAMSLHGNHEGCTENGTRQKMGKWCRDAVTLMEDSSQGSLTLLILTSWSRCSH